MQNQTNSQATRDNLLQRSEIHLNEFQKAMETHLDAMRELIERYAADAGDKMAMSQKLCLMNAWGELGNTVDGTTEDDMKATEEQLIAQLEHFCEENKLTVMSAEELLCEDEATLTYDQAEWLEYYVERWNRRPQ